MCCGIVVHAWYHVRLAAASVKLEITKKQQPVGCNVNAGVEKIDFFYKNRKKIMIFLIYIITSIIHRKIINV